MFLSSGEGYLGKLLEFHKESQVPFRIPRGNVGFLGNAEALKGILKGVGRILWVAWSCGGKLRVLLELRVDLEDPHVSPQGSQISFCVARGTSVFFMLRYMDE